jgi:hypothetical protein
MQPLFFWYLRFNVKKVALILILFATLNLNVWLPYWLPYYLLNNRELCAVGLSCFTAQAEFVCCSEG